MKETPVLSGMNRAVYVIGRGRPVCFDGRDVHRACCSLFGHALQPSPAFLADLALLATDWVFTSTYLFSGH